MNDFCLSDVLYANHWTSVIQQTHLSKHMLKGVWIIDCMGLWSYVSVNLRVVLGWVGIWVYGCSVHVLWVFIGYW